MPNNLFVTGPPRSGKTTVIRRVVDRLQTRGYRVGGLYSPERRESGARVGFGLKDVATGETRELASVDRETGPAVGKYRVNVPNLDAMAESAIAGAREDADVVVVDEVAPMETESEGFVREVRRALDTDQPVLAAVHYRATSGFIGEVKARDDAERFEVTPETRDDLPATLVDRLTGALDT